MDFLKTLGSSMWSKLRHSGFFELIDISFFFIDQFGSFYEWKWQQPCYEVL
jgi:hypothetical protein